MKAGSHVSIPCSKSPAVAALKGVAWLQQQLRDIAPNATVQLITRGALSFPLAAQSPGGLWMDVRFGLGA
jgi:hypothetical protein